MSTPAPAPTLRLLYTGAVVLPALVLALLAAVLVPSWTDEAVSLTGGSATEVVTLTVDRPRAGATDVAVRLAPRPGQRDEPPATVTLQAVLPTTGHAAPATTAHLLAPGTYTAAVHLMMPGRWTFHVTLDRAAGTDQFDFPLAVSG
ncbi:hypothetical protein [Streptomyces tremellae]|uniref:YtkA-like domain-containing protein n=1 Tax=Streptomyces tremellae TaxID=1124239 RepID=A0ABP7G2S8_9ACTN